MVKLADGREIVDENAAQENLFSFSLEREIFVLENSDLMQFIRGKCNKTIAAGPGKSCLHRGK